MIWSRLGQAIDSLARARGLATSASPPGSRNEWALMTMAGRGIIVIIYGRTEWVVGPADAAVWLLVREAGLPAHSPSIMDRPEWLLLDATMGDPRARDELAVLADLLQGDGDPLGEWLALWLTGLCAACEGRALLGGSPECETCSNTGAAIGAKEAEIAATLDDIAQRVYFFDRGGLAWCSRKTKVGDRVQVDGLLFEARRDVWTVGKDKLMVVSRREGKVGKRVPKAKRADPRERVPWNAGPNPYQGGPQGDELAAREARARARGWAPYPGTDD